MKTVIIEYARICPTILANLIERAFGCSVFWSDIDEDYFEFSVFGVLAYQMAELEDTLAEYL